MCIRDRLKRAVHAITHRCAFKPPVFSLLPFAARLPRQRIERLQRCRIRAIIFPCRVARIARKLTRATPVAPAHGADPLQIPERGKIGRGDLLRIKIKRSHSTQQKIARCRTAGRQFTKLGHRRAQMCIRDRNTLSGSLAGLNYPLLETQDEWVMHGFSFANYLAELGPTAQQDIYKKSSIDLALRAAFRKMRSFLMTTKGLTEDEAISLISIGVDFGVTQVVDGNWGIHAIIKKSLFAGAATA